MSDKTQKILRNSIGILILLKTILFTTNGFSSLFLIITLEKFSFMSSINQSHLYVHNFLNANIILIENLLASPVVDVSFAILQCIN